MHIQDYKQSKNKKEFRYKVEQWKGFRLKFLEDHGIDKSKDKMLKDINHLLKQIDEDDNIKKI